MRVCESGAPLICSFETFWHGMLCTAKKSSLFDLILPHQKVCFSVHWHAAIPLNWNASWYFTEEDVSSWQSKWCAILQAFLCVDWYWISSSHVWRASTHLLSIQYSESHLAHFCDCPLRFCPLMRPDRYWRELPMPRTEVTNSANQVRISLRFNDFEKTDKFELVLIHHCGNKGVDPFKKN